LIEYEIIVQHKRDQKPQLELADPKSPDFRALVFRRNLKACKYKDEDRVKVRGTSRKGFILRIEDDINKVNWERNRPHFVQVRFDDGSVMMCNPSQLKRTNK
jgi:hypothetical protein